MPLDVSIGIRPNYLYFRVGGTYEIYEAIERFNEVLSAIINCKVFKILIDYRNLHNVKAFTDMDEA